MKEARIKVPFSVLPADLVEELRADCAIATFQDGSTAEKVEGAWIVTAGHPQHSDAGHFMPDGWGLDGPGGVTDAG